MKKILWLLVVAMLIQYPILAEDNSEDSGAAPGALSSWYMGTGLGVAVPSQDWNPDFTLGGGGNIFAGYRFNPNLALQVDLNPWFFTGNGHTLADGRAFCDLRVSLPSKGYVTYVLLGPGYDLQVASPSGYNTGSLAGNFGLGAQFDIHPGSYLFVEFRYDALLYNNLTQQDVPIFFGLMEDL
jgi:hypothetical protein